MPHQKKGAKRTSKLATPRVRSPMPMLMESAPATVKPSLLPISRRGVVGQEYEPASLSRPFAGHIISAILLAVLIAGIYGRISWGMFIGSSDFRGHLSFAERFYQSGRPAVPHFLFHGITAALFAAHVASSFISAGRLVMVGCYLVIPALLYGLFWTEFRQSNLGRPLILFAAGLATLLAQPITLAHAYALGYFWPEPYQIPTSTLLKPFALAGFACAAWYVAGRRTDMRLTAAFALATVAGSLSKPSFLICILPAVTVLTTFRLVRKLPVSVAGLLFGLYLPATLVLAWQFYATYAGHSSQGSYNDTIDWAPFKFMNAYATGLLSKFLLTIAFPLLVLVSYWRTARYDTMLQLSWLTFLFGTFYSYMLVERVFWAAGNFTWSGAIATFTLLVGSVIFWLRQITSEASGWWFQQRAWICGIALALHVISGIRLDWQYLTHYGCGLNFLASEFICIPPVSVAAVSPSNRPLPPLLPLVSPGDIRAAERSPELTQPAGVVVDSINDRQATQKLVFEPGQRSLNVQGWAIDTIRLVSAGGVFITVEPTDRKGRKVVTQAGYGTERADVASALGQPALTYVGYRALIDCSSFPKGNYRMNVRVMASDRKSFFRPGPPILFELR